jgi:hypothetical protein
MNTNASSQQWKQNGNNETGVSIEELPSGESRVLD